MVLFAVEAGENPIEGLEALERAAGIDEMDIWAQRRDSLVAELFARVGCVGAGEERVGNGGERRPRARLCEGDRELPAKTRPVEEMPYGHFFLWRQIPAGGVEDFNQLQGNGWANVLGT